MPSSEGASARRIVDAVRSGELDEAVLDTAIERLVGLLERALCEPATSGSGADDGSPATPGFDADAHHALARRAAAEGVVLLKNDGQLPLPAGVGSTGSPIARLMTSTPSARALAIFFRNSMPVKTGLLFIFQ